MLEANEVKDTRIDHLFYAGAGVAVVSADVYDLDSSASDHSAMVREYKISSTLDKTSRRMVQKLQTDATVERVNVGGV